MPEPDEHFRMVMFDKLVTNLSKFMLIQTYEPKLGRYVWRRNGRFAKPPQDLVPLKEGADAGA